MIRTTRIVNASIPKHAEAKCKEGQAAYVESEIEKGDELRLETVSVEQHK